MITMTKHAFEQVSPQVHFPELEERILAYWKEHHIFEKSVATRPKNKTWTFLDGPPFITGLPHYGSLLSSIPKDLFPRFWTMKGYRVRRVWGWDCHGLPAENKVEDKLKIKRKKDIEEKVGLKKFIDQCKLYVQDVSTEWEWYVDHVGRWVDFKNAYKTMDTPYMESVMWVFKTMYDKGYIYKGLRVSLYCPHCSTPISNFEVAMDPDNYQSTTEPTAIYKYQLKDDPTTYLLAWSTTPWNKIATPALAVNPKLTYVKVKPHFAKAPRGKQGDEFYILAKDTVKILKSEYQVVEEFKGKDLVGKKFVPHYDYYPIEKGKRAFLVVGGDFVTPDEGTGIVTIAAYGQEDLALMQKEHIHIELHVDDEGMLKPGVPKWAGMYYRDVEPLVIADLTDRGLIYRVDPYTHTVPTCWRCHTRLIYAPQDAWYVDVQKLKPRLFQTNESTNWFPDHFKYGRFLKSMEAAPDWCISRSRYWGSPVPVWECVCGERFVPGSIGELGERSGRKITDLHKPDIDDVTIACGRCGKRVRRVSEVLDSWIEAGSASFAERHYPFEKGAQLKEFFPPDFIVEYTGQIRAWFYVLHVIAGAMYEQNAFKNVVVTGVILGTDGRKMSKNFGNYPDPKELLQKYGGDALRMYLMGSPVMHGEDIRISEEEYRYQVRGTLLVLWNVYNFFVTYAKVDGYDTHAKYQANHATSKHVLDQWICALLVTLIDDVTGSLEAYDSVKAIEYIKRFVDDLSTWYIRRSRERVGPSVDRGPRKDAFYLTTYDVLTTLVKLFAPIAPFISEEIYRNLTGLDSVHLMSWPTTSTLKEDVQQKIHERMALVRKICELGHGQRKLAKVKVRQPLRQFTIQNLKAPLDKDFLRLIEDELNVKEVRQVIGEGELRGVLDTTVTKELLVEGQVRELIRNIQILRKEKGCTIDARVSLLLPRAYQSLSDEHREKVQKETLTTITWGDSFELLTGSTRSS